MPFQRTYDEPDVLYKVLPGGQMAEHTTVLGKMALDEALADGWRDPSDPSTRLPSTLKYPTTFYRPDGSTRKINSDGEYEQAQLPCTPTCQANCFNHNWEIKRYPAPPVREANYKEPPAEPGSKAASESALAIKLIESNEKIAAQDKRIDELMAQNAEILQVLKSQAKKAPKDS